jgi:hypothetical protein
METLTFFKIPISISDSTTTFHLFDILLPSKLDENILLSVLRLLCKLRPLLSNQKNVEEAIVSFLDAQPFVIFNYVYIPEIADDKENRVSNEGIKWIHIGDRKFSINNQEQSDFHFNGITCMEFMKLYTCYN